MAVMEMDMAVLAIGGAIEDVAIGIVHLTLMTLAIKVGV